MGTLKKMVELRKQLPVMTKLKAKGTAFCVEIGTAGQGISTVNLQVAITQLVDGGIEFMDQVTSVSKNGYTFILMSMSNV